jgi:hypothetical protein
MPGKSASNKKSPVTDINTRNRIALNAQFQFHMEWQGCFDDVVRIRPRAINLVRPLKIHGKTIITHGVPPSHIMMSNKNRTSILPIELAHTTAIHQRKKLWIDINIVRKSYADWK